MSIEVKNLDFSYAGVPVLRGVSFAAHSGELIAVLGPNGVGKSTLFGCILGLLKPNGGSVLLDGAELQSLSRAQIAGKLAYIPQSSDPAFNHTVLDLVLMGAANRLRPFEQPGAVHRQRALEILESLGIAPLAGRGCMQLSGGERQLALIARALMQQARTIIMDEPTANLDYGNAFRVMQRIESLSRAGYTILFSTHEPNQAFRYASRVLALHGGGLLADGTPEAVLSEQTLSALYRIGVSVRTVELGERSFRISIPRDGEEMIKNDSKEKGEKA